MSRIWSREYGSVHQKSSRALTVLNDSRISYLVEAVFSHQSDTGDEPYFSELEYYYVYVSSYTHHYHELIYNLSHPDYSFLVLRNIYYRLCYKHSPIENFFNSARVLLMCVGLIVRVQPFECAVEWPVLDEFLVYYNKVKDADSVYNIFNSFPLTSLFLRYAYYILGVESHLSLDCFKLHG